MTDNWDALNKNKDDDELYLKIPYSAIKNYELELSMGETSFVDFTADASKIKGIGDFI